MSDIDSEEEIYSIKSSQEVYKRSRSRTRVSDTPKLVDRSEEKRQSTTYLPVAKWAVDYNNKNYIRSQCNKNKGLHRKIRGRPLKWHIEYDNNYHQRSKVNSPKGLHRKKPEVKRKYVPDEDDLADASGWEFDNGPEYDQVEQDVLFIPEGRIVARGCYRWYGVKRNDSDCDVKQKEYRENLLTEELEAELKGDDEFLQADRLHMADRSNRQYSRGAYRHYETPRNVYDILPDLPSIDHDPEWRRKHHTNGIQYLEVEMCDKDKGSEHRIVKGKPFKRTILNKVYELRKKEDSRDSGSRHATRLSLVPGEGDRTLYRGKSVFKKTSERELFRSREGSDYEEYEREDTLERYEGELSPKYEEKMRRMAEEKRRSPRYSSYEHRDSRAPSSGRFDEYAYRVKSADEPEPRKYRSAPRAGGSERDVRQEFETWRENTENMVREREMDARRSGDRRPPERKRAVSLKDYNNYDSREKNAAGARRREREIDEAAYRARGRRGSESSIKDYGHASREKDGTRGRRKQDREDRRGSERRLSKRRESFKEYNNASRDANTLQNAPMGDEWEEEDEYSEYRVEKRRSSSRKDKPSYSRGHDPRDRVTDRRKSSRRQDYDYSDHRPSQRNKAGSNRFRMDSDSEELDHGRDKVPKKMPPHVEKRIREIQNELDREMEFEDHRHKGDRDVFRGSGSSDSMERDKGPKKMPPHVEKRMKEIRDKMGKTEFDDRRHKGDREVFNGSGRGQHDIDLMKHKDHPRDRGESHDSGYEKYVTKNGSEYWIKKEESFSEIHCKGPQ